VTSISEDDVRSIVHSPTALVGSDGNCVATYGTVSQGMPHPRFYGTFPRVISRYVYDERLIPLEQAIYKMTGGSAKALKLRDRGLLRTGYRATSQFLIQMTFATRPLTPTPTVIRARAHDCDRQRDDGGR
jgi:N-acyl-D-amino-acid deacylase